jgi:hypothetical protein
MQFLSVLFDRQWRNCRDGKPTDGFACIHRVASSLEKQLFIKRDTGYARPVGSNSLHHKRSFVHNYYNDKIYRRNWRPQDPT